ncbi:MAG TPA: DUF2986 domain-containing protein [Vibrio sp.]|uniref:DUF2986 domain-containing protein n=1 Tax=unclassified Vibrio TaxID=2614977 RepID=UPI000ED70D0A|nr:MULTISPECIES: DUF2986 domain-containing protein [unclassified Vibrio]MCF7355030.1 DUF2986 domain-containing protein [Vibrio sp. CK2-1]HCH00299.1 DUF2986 domain-containing protein [Vibrio sp.]
MNRKKKINSILKKRLKQQNSKLHKTNKPKYISKAERARMEEEAQTQAPSDDVQTTDQVESEQ